MIQVKALWSKNVGANLSGITTDLVFIDPVEDRPIYEIGKEAETKHGSDETVNFEEVAEHNATVVSEKLTGIVAKNSWRVEPYYIWMSSVYEGVSSVLYQQLGYRETRPDAEPGMTLWKYDNKGNVLTLEWHLPPTRNWDVIFATPEAFPQSLIQWIKQYQIGILK